MIGLLCSSFIRSPWNPILWRCSFLKSLQKVKFAFGQYYPWKYLSNAMAETDLGFLSKFNTRFTFNVWTDQPNTKVHTVSLNSINALRVRRGSLNAFAWWNWVQYRKQQIPFSLSLTLEHALMEWNRAPNHYSLTLFTLTFLVPLPLLVLDGCFWMQLHWHVFSFLYPVIILFSRSLPSHLAVKIRTR